MTQSTVRTISGDSPVSGPSRVQRSDRGRVSRNARRRWLILFSVVLIVVIGILANVKPLAHYREASVRLDKASATVTGLQAHKAKLESDLAKLGETGYLETLAREQLSYARPGEDLYIVTGPSGDAAGSEAQKGVVPSGPVPLIGAGIAFALDPHSGATTTGGGPQVSGTTDAAGTARTEDQRGLLERIVSAVRGLF